MKNTLSLFKDYLTEFIPLDYFEENIYLNYWTPPIFIFLIILVINNFIDDNFLTALISAGLITMFFGVGNYLSFAFFNHYKNSQSNTETNNKVYTWEIYITAFSGYLIGHLFYGTGCYYLPILHSKAVIFDEYWILFSKTTPIWLIIAILVNSLSKNRYYLRELDLLENINSELELQQNNNYPATNNKTENTEQVNNEATLDLGMITNTNNKTEAVIPLNKIIHITVTEHYCQIFQQKEQQQETNVLEIRSPLKDIKNLLSKDFVQIHRSHVINLNHVSHIDKRARSYEVTLCTGSITLPVSRHRVPEVFPLLAEKLGLNKA